jgi:hypothetical protein
MSFGFLRRLRGPLLGAAATALVFVTASAVAGSGVGGIFNLGENNTVNQQTQLTGTVGGNPQLRVENSATGSGSFGVLGKMASGSAAADSAGVRGINAASGANGFGVIGIHNGSGVGVFGQTGAGTGVRGTHTGTTGTNPGVEGVTASNNGGAAGVLGSVTSASAAAGSAGVRGTNASTDDETAGVEGTSAQGIGVFGHGKVGVLGCTELDFACPHFFSLESHLPDSALAGAFYAPQPRGNGLVACAGGLCQIGTANGGIAGQFVASGGGIGIRARVPNSDGGTAGVFEGVFGTGIEASGDVLAGHFTGSIEVTNSIKKDYVANTPSQATPTAYGDVTSGGSTVTTASTPNVSSTFDSVNKRYVITITGEAYDINHYVTTVTPINTAPRFVATQSSGGKLLVRLFDLSGTAVQSPFEFVTYKP